MKIKLNQDKTKIKAQTVAAIETKSEVITSISATDNTVAATKSPIKSIGNKKSDTKSSSLKWPLQVGILTLALALLFSVTSEFLLAGAGMIIAFILILVLILISIVFDMLGVASAACLEEPLLAMAAKRITGAREAIALVKNADKVSSVSSDVIGDICGILSGAAGAALALSIITSVGGGIIIGTVVSSIIAALTVLGKALCKGFAFENSETIVLFAGKVIYFTRNIFKKKA